LLRTGFTSHSPPSWNPPIFNTVATWTDANYVLKGEWGSRQPEWKSGPASVVALGRRPPARASLPNHVFCPGRSVARKIKPRRHRRVSPREAGAIRLSKRREREKGKWLDSAEFSPSGRNSTMGWFRKRHVTSSRLNSLRISSTSHLWGNQNFRIQWAGFQPCQFDVVNMDQSHCLSIRIFQVLEPCQIYTGTLGCLIISRNVRTTILFFLTLMNYPRGPYLTLSRSGATRRYRPRSSRSGLANPRHVTIATGAGKPPRPPKLKCSLGMSSTVRRCWSFPYLLFPPSITRPH
jgi:hypothetical protein